MKLSKQKQILDNHIKQQTIERAKGSLEAFKKGLMTKENANKYIKTNNDMFKDSPELQIELIK